MSNAAQLCNMLDTFVSLVADTFVRTFT